jgi:hypothetical protein
LYESSRDHKKVFKNAGKWYSFCECSKDWKNLLRGGPLFARRSSLKKAIDFVKDGMGKVADFLGIDDRGIFLVKGDVESMTECVKRLEKEGDLKAFFEGMGREFSVEFDLEYKKEDDWKLYWKRGRLADIQDGGEFMYFHLLGLKEEKRFIVPQWSKIPENFFITKEGFS